jgi:hypothetical protein
MITSTKRVTLNLYHQQCKESAMHFIPLLPHDATVFSIITGAAPIVLTLYGFLRFWPNFIKQKRLENVSIKAKEALDHLTILEAALHELILTANKHIPYPTAHPDQTSEYIRAQFKTWTALNTLRNSLLLIKNDVNLHEILAITQLVQWVEDLETILERMYHGFPPHVTIHDLFNTIKPQTLDAKEPKHNPLEQLRLMLLHIYEYRHIYPTKLNDISQ